MKGIIVFVLALIVLVSSVSAEIIILQQPNAVYNYGDILSVPFKVKTTGNFAGNFDANLICNGIQTNIYKNGLFLSPGEEKEIEAATLLTQQTTSNNASVFCISRAVMGSESAVTTEFKISDLIQIELTTNKTEFNPQENIILEGNAKKENGNPSNGFINLIFVPQNSSENLTFQNTVNNGHFSVAFNLPKETKAGKYLLKFEVYETDASGSGINKGEFDSTIDISQVPTSLEIVFENKNVIPGENLRIKSVLHDQTGEKIGSSVIISVKDSFNKLREQSEKPTDEFWDIPTKYNEQPGTWTAIAISEGITSEMDFEIVEKESADIKIVNNTLIVTNTGNVRYNETLLIKIGPESKNLLIDLEVDETRKYTLTAPEGEYYVEVIGNGETHASNSVFLTGKVIDVKGYSGTLSFMKYPLAWVFVVLVLVFVLAMTIMKGYNKTFIGYMTPGKKEISSGATAGLSLLRKKPFTLKSRSKAELSLSLKGEKQAASFVLLKIKNAEELKGSESAEKAIQDVIDFAEESKAIAYLSQEGFGNILFILAPLVTKTFKNEVSAINAAKKFSEILEKYNKIAKQKIDFGISLNSGDIVVKRETKTLFKFATFGNLVNTLRKIASASEKMLLLGEDIKNKIFSEMSVEKHIKDGLSFYTLKEPRYKGDSTKFIKDFVKRLDQNK